MAQDIKHVAETLDQVRKQCTAILWMLDRIEQRIHETADGADVAKILALGLTTKQNYKDLMRAYDGFMNVKALLKTFGEHVKGAPRVPRTKTRVCKVCKVEKPIERFAFNHQARNLRQHMCKQCKSTAEKERLRKKHHGLIEVREALRNG